MENSTLGFLAILIALFIIVKYVTAPNEVKKTPIKNKLTLSSSSSSTETKEPSKPKSQPPRPITKDMIEIVQQIGPMLTEEQVVFDLQKTGSIELTIEKFLAEGNLPEPPVTKTTKKSWSDSKEERNLQLEQRKQDMIMKARIRLRKQLTNELDL